jgi:ADP-ribose pyrophosphatase YjhB (NUDIX family)
MSDLPPILQARVGAAGAIFDRMGRVLLVHHTYGRLNWELPGGFVEPGESPDEGARRELHEETGLQLEIDRLSGVYFEPDHALGSALHFVFRFRQPEEVVPVAASAEISEVAFWPTDDLPGPISDFTERRIRDALDLAPPSVVRIGPRRWRE